MRFHPHTVKDSPDGTKLAPIWPRWLEGWALAFPSVGVALLAGWLALPQGTMPNYLPLPTVSEPDLVRAIEQQKSEAEQARQHALAYEARAVGESLRQLGRLAHGGEPIDIERRNRFRKFAKDVRREVGDTPLKQLRSIQTELFLAALADWEKHGDETDDLIELGGDFIAVASELGWAKVVKGGKPSLSLERDERVALFVTRWTDLAGLTDDATLRLAPVWPIIALCARLRLPLSELGVRDLSLVRRLKMLAPNYPEQLSRGLIYAHLGERTQAIEAFQSHLAAHPDGPYALRARNHLVYALEKMTGNGD